SLSSILVVSVPGPGLPGLSPGPLRFSRNPNSNPSPLLGPTLRTKKPLFPLRIGHGCIPPTVSGTDFHPGPYPPVRPSVYPPVHHHQHHQSHGTVTWQTERWPVRMRMAPRRAAARVAPNYNVEYRPKAPTSLSPLLAPSDRLGQL